MEPPQSEPLTPRRTLIKRMMAGLSALFALLLGFPAIAYLIDPRNRRTVKSDFQRVARLSELPKPGADGRAVPRQFVIRELRRDAWTLHPDSIVGRVWLMRGGDDRVRAFTTICPHLGCSINLGESGERFVCPCHNAAFTLDGERVGEAQLGRTNPAPRGMDEIEVRLVAEFGSDDVAIEVKYQSFRQGAHEKILKA